MITKKQESILIAVHINRLMFATLLTASLVLNANQSSVYQCDAYEHIFDI